MKLASDPANPWSWNAFEPPAGDVKAPSPHPRTPKLIPDVERLFSLQRDALKVVNGLESLESQIGKAASSREWLMLKQDAENTYRVIRSYLGKNAGPEVGMV